MSVTVVSAFYPLAKAKHGIHEYIQWIRNFCMIPCNLVVFTTSDFAQTIRQARGSLPLIVIERSFHSFEMTTPEMMEFWNYQHTIDPEQRIHSPELYAVWAMKQEWVQIAIRENPFSSNWFVWCDIGIQRVPALQQFYLNFPSKTPELCPPGRMCFLEVKPIPETFVSKWAAGERMPYPIPAMTALGGGCIIGDCDAWEEYGKAYVGMLQELKQGGWFAGSDQYVNFAILMNRKTQKPFRLYHSKTFANVSEIYWMSFPVILGGAAPAEIDMRFE